MDFYQIKERSIKKGETEIYPDFKVCRSKDLMIRGKSFYAIWDENQQIWSTDEYDVQRLVDDSIYDYREKIRSNSEEIYKTKLMSNFSSGSWTSFRKYMLNLSDNAHQLDEKLTFANADVKKKDYASKKLPYNLEEGPIPAYEELISTLYSPEERAKLEWAIGAIVAGDSKDIQKFIVLYGQAGSGKSTLLNIIQKLFTGYYTTFEAKALTSTNNSFSTEVFKGNPLVAIQHDGDLSRIEDNTKLNSIISHEEMTMNEKYKPSYTAKVNCFLFMATNKPVKITDGKSGIIRRLIDVRPSDKKVPTKLYHTLLSQIDFELGAIAFHCLEVYQEMGKNYYSNYRPLDMILQTDVFFNFVETNFAIFKDQPGISLSQAYEMYKVYCEEALVDFKLPRHKFREELKNYFVNFAEVARIDGKQIRSYYSDFNISKFTNVKGVKEEHANSLVLDSKESIFDEVCQDCPAQYASSTETPIAKWSEVKTILSDLNTKKLHYVKVPENHIVIDFDIKDDNGKKSLEKNIEAASNWPITYAELSKSGSGVHLHYIYEGDVTMLSRVYSEGVEIKVFSGNSSLRRKLTKCNQIPIHSINSGLPLKGAKMINFDVVKSEKALRELIRRNLDKEIHPGTKPSMDFINTILDDAYSSGLSYDVTDMRPSILTFAVNSSNQSSYCVKLIDKMKFKSEDQSLSPEQYNDENLVFFDVEVFPNLFIVVWKMEGRDPVKMINPQPKDIEDILKFKLVGFNCRRYDNHILYARYIGYNNLQLYQLSQKIINNSKNAMFGEAYNLSYTDVYDFTSKKQSLKKYEIELGLRHQELGYKWDEPVDEKLWENVADYCVNDVLATEATFYARKQDFVARQILADLSGLTVNDSTQQQTAKIIFGSDQNPQEKFVYTNLEESFPGYIFENGKSLYRDEDPGEGGYVYAEPGMYGDVALLDVVSMHPTSLILMDMFGPYTNNFKELLDARVAIKRKDYKSAKKMLNGALSKYLTNDDDSVALSYALKIVINIVYGLTSAKFPNKFKDKRNVDNIVAKRGALFMIDLKHAVQAQGFTVAHIKTDSIKIPDANQYIIKFVQDFGEKYGYTFEHEATYDKLCLVNDSVYIAKYKDGTWTATGAQFAQPYVLKTLFTHEGLEFDDMCETKTVSTALYLDMNEKLPEGEHDYHFVGKAGSFCPVTSGGGLLMREKDEKYYAATGTKGYRWLESEMVKAMGKEADVDQGYYVNLVDAAVKDISKFGDFEWFIGDEPYYPKKDDVPPWLMPCGDAKYKTCMDCPNLMDEAHAYYCGIGYDISSVMLKGEKNHGKK